MMELARACALKKPYATLMFVATAGEEQDLYGATFLSDTLKNASVNVEANFNNDIVGTGNNEPFNPINQHTIRLFGAGTDFLATETDTYVEVLISIGGECPRRLPIHFAEPICRRERYSGQKPWPLCAGDQCWSRGGH
jgi:Zn-dependent M28 family amino/carboxypeptidase